MKLNKIENYRYREGCFYGVLERLTETDYKELIGELENNRQWDEIVLVIARNFDRVSYLPDASIKFIIEKLKEMII